jgi:hypothetical protein
MATWHLGLSTDHFIHARVAFLLTTMIGPCHVLREFLSSSVIPIPKKPNVYCSESDNFCGITLGSTFCKVFDNTVLEKFHDKLRTSGLQL